jgi:ribosome-associated translation inhibitor RaiA
MTFPIAIALRGVEWPDALRADVQERVQHLDYFVDDILACRVLIEAKPRRLHMNCHYGVRVRITLPCTEIEAGGKPMPDRHHEDPYFTVAETFDTLTHRIEDYVRRRCISCTRYAKSDSGG